MIALLVAGLGAIGLALVEHVSRMSAVSSVLLVDHDSFTDANVSSQLVSLRYSGHAKVAVAAARMAEVNPALRIEKRQCRLEELPRGCFRGRVVISCLDSRLARTRLAGLCFAMGVELWLDAGVRPDGVLTRVSVMFPSHPGATCLCCGWSAREWDAITAQFSCAGEYNNAPTRSPSYLGAAAAAQVAHLLNRHSAGNLPACADMESHMLSMYAHRAWTTTVRRNPDCRSRHERWSIEQLGKSAAGCKLGEFHGMKSLSLPGLPFVHKLRCGCGHEKKLLFVASRFTSAQLRCPSCGRPMRFGALDLADDIDLFGLEGIGPETSALALADVGVTDGDVIRLDGPRYLEVSASATERRV